jgi:exodeoxyribonuclease VII small subunit
VSDQQAVAASGGNSAAETSVAEIAAMSFDVAMLELQRTVAELEQGGLALERSIALYERGVALYERCEALLGEAELRVQKLLERSAGTLEVAEIRPADAAEQQ